MRAQTILLILALAGAGPLVAQEPAAPAPEVPTVSPAPAVPVEGLSPTVAAKPEAREPTTEVTIDRKDQLDAALTLGGPLGVGFRLRLLHGLGADVEEGEERVKVVCAVPTEYCAGGFLLGAEAGTGGGKLSLGLGAGVHVEDEDFRGRVGADLKLSLARTWGRPIGTEPSLTYLGPELGLSVLRFGLDLGLLWRLSGHAGHSVLFTWGLALRL